MPDLTFHCEIAATEYYRIKLTPEEAARLSAADEVERHDFASIHTDRWVFTGSGATESTDGPDDLEVED